MGRVATGQKKRDRRSRAWDGPLFPCPCPGLLLLQTSVWTTRSQCGLQVGVLSAC